MQASGEPRRENAVSYLHGYMKSRTEIGGRMHRSLVHIPPNTWTARGDATLMTRERRLAYRTTEG
jgi:hypothetical protein